MLNMKLNWKLDHIWLLFADSIYKIQFEIRSRTKIKVIAITVFWYQSNGPQKVVTHGIN